MSSERDLLEAGRPDSDERSTWSPRQRLAVVVGVVVLAAGVVIWRSDPPEVPALDVAPVSVGTPAEDGPGGPGRVQRRQLEVELRSERSAAQVVVRRLVGPGVVTGGDRPRPVRVPTDGSAVLVTLFVVLDCDRIPLPLPQDAYSLDVQASAGGRSAGGRVGLGLAAEPWAAAVERDCLRPEAESLVRVSAVSGEVHPREPRVRLSMVVENRSALSAGVVAESPGAGVRASRASSRLEPGARGRLALDVRLARCPSWPTGAPPTSTADTPVPLSVSFRVGQPPSPSGAGPYAGLDPAAAEDFRALLVAACAGIAAPVAITSPDETRYDARSRALSVTVSIYLPAGWPGRVVVTPTNEIFGGRPSVAPLSGPTGRLAADRTGLVRVPVRYSLVPSCAGQGPWLPLDVEASLPTPKGDRTARFRLYAETFLPAVDLDAACGS